MGSCVIVGTQACSQRQLKKKPHFLFYLCLSPVPPAPPRKCPEVGGGRNCTLIIAALVPAASHFLCPSLRVAPAGTSPGTLRVGPGHVRLREKPPVASQGLGGRPRLPSSPWTAGPSPAGLPSSPCSPTSGPVSPSLPHGLFLPPRWPVRVAASRTRLCSRPLGSAPSCQQSPAPVPPPQRRPPDPQPKCHPRLSPTCLIFKGLGPSSCPIGQPLWLLTA